MVVSDNLQITIPREISEQAGIRPGMEVELYMDATGVHLRKINEPSPGELLVQHMRGKGSFPISTDEIMAMTRGED